MLCAHTYRQTHLVFFSLWKRVVNNRKHQPYSTEPKLMRIIKHNVFNTNTHIYPIAPHTHRVLYSYSQHKWSAVFVPKYLCFTSHRESKRDCGVYFYAAINIRFLICMHNKNEQILYHYIEILLRNSCKWKTFSFHSSFFYSKCVIMNFKFWAFSKRRRKFLIFICLFSVLCHDAELSGDSPQISHHFYYFIVST